MDRLARFFRLNPDVDTLLLASWDSVFATDSNFLYFSGCEIDRSTLIARRGHAPVLLCNPMNYELAKEKFRGETVKFEQGGYRKKLASMLKGSKSIGVPKTDVSASFHDNLRKATNAKFIDVSESLLLQRSVKEEGEIALIRHACAVSQKALKQLEISPGKTEAQLCSELQSILYSLGAEPSFKPLILAGRSARFPHGKSGNGKVKKGEILLIDWGAKVDGYCADFTRCFFIGKPNPSQEKTYEKLQLAFDEILAFLRPGISAKDVSEFAAELIRDAGLPPMPHTLGHGIGLDVHEYPSFRKDSGHTLRQGNVLAIEPSAYFKQFGARFENTILLRKRAELL